MDIEEKRGKAAKVLEIAENPPGGSRVITDPDTILADIIGDADVELTGIAAELIRIWNGSTDTDSIEALFELFTDVPFEEYLERAIAGSTR